MSMNTLRLTAPRAVLLAALLLAAALPARLAAQEISVCPGINSEYDEPNVPAYVARFERPGREVFDRRHEIVAACRVRPGCAVADVGAGTGLFTRLFATLVGERGRVYAVDICEDFIDHVRATCTEQRLMNVRGVVSNPESVDLPTRSVDLAFICDTYHHFEYPFRMMRSIAEALRPHGEVVVIDYVREAGVSPDWVLRHVRAGRDTVIGEIESCGFRLVEQRSILTGQYFLRFVKQQKPVREVANISEAPIVWIQAEPGSSNEEPGQPRPRLPLVGRVVSRLRNVRGR
jgi:ubiquinone/menaquinone biosynthesis C-methylase UbiE